jgi:hypothetical protein
MQKVVNLGYVNPSADPRTSSSYWTLLNIANLISFLPFWMKPEEIRSFQYSVDEEDLQFVKIQFYPAAFFQTTKIKKGI